MTHNKIFNTLREYYVFKARDMGKKEESVQRYTERIRNRDKCMGIYLSVEQETEFMGYIICDKGPESRDASIDIQDFIDRMTPLQKKILLSKLNA